MCVFNMYTIRHEIRKRKKNCHINTDDEDDDDAY